MTIEKLDPKTAVASMDGINACLRHLNWIKSDLADVRELEESSDEESESSRSRHRGSSKKRRIDIMATPQFAEVVRYITQFEDPEEVLDDLWSIADGETDEDDLDIIKSYLGLLKKVSELKPSSKMRSEYNAHHRIASDTKAKSDDEWTEPKIDENKQ